MLSLLAALMLSSPRLVQPGGGSSAGGYSTIEDEGTPLTQRSTVNFTGAGVSCSDSGGETVCNVTGGAGGGESPFIRSLGGL